MNVPHILLSENGPNFSRIVQGLWRLNEWDLDEVGLDDFVHFCLENGINTFDNADIYGMYTCETIFGTFLKRHPGIRPDIQVISKCDIKLPGERWPGLREKTYDTGREHILLSVETTLKFLNTDYLDVLLLHRPDPLMDADEVAEVFLSLKKAGKVRYFGVSNFSPAQFDLLASRLSFPLVTNQVEFSPLHLNPLDDGTFDHCQQHRVLPMAWSPLAGGRLFYGDDEQAGRVRNTLYEISEEIGGCGMDEVALAWVLKHPAKVLPVIGTGKKERIRSAVCALDLDLTREQWYRVWKASKNHDLP